MKKNLLDKDLFLAQAINVSNQDFDKVQSCLVLAPHPDDETLGCGGLIAMLRNKGANVFVIVTTDGSQSHPNSKAFPPKKVTLMRKEEVLGALHILGVSKQNVEFFDGKDASLPGKGEPGFDLLVDKLISGIEKYRPQLILVPYQLDPHCDHRATWQILQQALKSFKEIGVWEYPIWLYELAEKHDIPTLKKGELKKVNIRNFLSLKKKAITSHISQTTSTINDDPTGFMLTEEVIKHFTTDFEFYIDRQ